MLDVPLLIRFTVIKHLNSDFKYGVWFCGESHSDRVRFAKSRSVGRAESETSGLGSGAHFEFFKTSLASVL